MTILFDAAAPVKSVRNTFGRGLLRSTPHTVDATHTAADEAWLIADRARREEDARFDRMAAQREAERLMEAGHWL